VDGVCCNAACTETCNACSAAKKGSGVNGTCGPIKYDTDPDNECYGGSCSGNGTCEQFNGLSCTATTDCLSHYCVDGFCCNNFCGGTCLACSAAKKGNGNDGQCGTIGSNTDPDNECPLGACNGAGTCTVLGAADGTACMAGSECASGQCVDGVCCNTACTGTCVACDLPGKVGTCSNIDAGQSDPNGTPPCNDVCNGAGQCVVGGGAACMSGSECASLICRDQVCESPKPANGPLQWMTIPTWDAFTIEQIAAFNDGQGVAVLGDHGYSKLRGSFNAAGFPNLGYWGIGANTFTAYQFVARGGVIAAYETTDYYCIEPDLCSYTCYFSVPAGISGPAVYIIGKNDAGQVAAIVSSPPANCEPAPGYGIVSPTDKLMRASAAGATQ